MAILTTENKILLTVKKAGQVSFPGVTVESARAVSELLQRDKNGNNGFRHSKGTHSVPCGDMNTTDLTYLLRIYRMTHSLLSDVISLTLPEPRRPRPFSFL